MKKIKMIEPKVILQINATLIAGILILISVIVVSEDSFDPAISNNEQDFALEKFTPNNPKDWAYFGGSMFGLSAILALIASIKNSSESRLTFLSLGVSIGFLGIGFLMLTIGFVKLGFE